ncbi:MAG TPA: proton-conducting transporter membrane subunit [Thermoanaerobaculia bacterium]|nr:proton-conducting transporter membrane subunit [Thermoanaerobaculia bacterium]
MLSLAGLPPTVGFIGKFLVFRAAVDAGLVWLALIGVLGSLISVGYCLRVVYVLWMKEPVREVSLVPEDLLSGAAFLLTAALMLVWGVFPRALLEVAHGAAAAFTGR